MLAFLDDGDVARLRLATARHHPSIHDDWLIEHGAEAIAHGTAVTGNPFIDAHADDGAEAGKVSVSGSTG